MMHRNPSMHCLHPALSLILHQQTVSLFPLFPSCVFIFTFFLFPLSFFSFLFCASPPGVSFFCIRSFSLFIFYFLSFAPIFLFIFSFLHYISHTFFYVLCLLFLLFFPSFSILLSSSPNPFLFFSRILPPLQPLPWLPLSFPILPLVSTLLSPSSYCTWCSAIRADSSLSFSLSLLPSPHSPSPPSVHPSLSTLCRLGFRQASSYQATGEMLIGFISGSLTASCSGLTAVMFRWLLIGLKGAGVILRPLLYFWANLFLHGCRPVR